MGRANSWSASNSTGTIDMGHWGEEDPGVSSVPLETQSEVKKSGFANLTLEGLPTHRYPIYIDNLNGKNNVPIVQECIHFTAVKQGGISLQKAADNSDALAAFEREQDNIANKGDPNDLGEDVSGDFGFYKGTAGSYSHNAETLEAAKGQKKAEGNERSESKSALAEVAGKIVSLFESQIKLIRTDAKNLEHCFLYMPNSVQFSEGASWGATALGGLGNLVKEGIRGGSSIGDMLKNFGGAVAPKVGQAAALGMGAAAAGTLGALGIASLLEGLGGGLRAAGRFTENPYEEQLFNGIDFRTFTFDFAFAPSNSSEAMEVDSIIKMFRKHSRPNFVVYL